MNADKALYTREKLLEKLKRKLNKIVTKQYVDPYQKEKEKYNKLLVRVKNSFARKPKPITIKNGYGKIKTEMYIYDIPDSILEEKIPILIKAKKKLIEEYERERPLLKKVGDQYKELEILICTSDLDSQVLRDSIKEFDKNIKLLQNIK